MSCQSASAEQMSQGQELLQLLGHELPHSAGSDVVAKKLVRNKVDDADWNVVIKRSFIEVVIPPHQQALRRCMSDSALLHFEKPEMPWKSEKLEQGMSDASTNMSLNGDDFGGSFGSSTRDDMPDMGFSSDSEGEADASLSYMQSWGMAFGDLAVGEGEGEAEYMESWWMPVEYNEQMGFDASCYMPMQWADVSYDCADPAAALDWSYDCTDSAAALGEWRSTVMIRNMPNNYTRDMLLELVDEMGFAGTYDFAYLPIDFQSQVGLGYAFINFSTVADAQLCFERFEGFSNWKVPSEKVCTVTWSSPTQGLEAHMERYRNSPVMHQGVRVDFPPPTKPLKTPKVRQHPAAKNV